VGGVPGHYQSPLQLVGDVLHLHKASGRILGVMLEVNDHEGDPLHIAVVSRVWPEGISQGCRVWLRGRLTLEREITHRRNSHYVVVEQPEHIAVVKRKEVHGA
jgi:hypothetical protein